MEDFARRLSSIDRFVLSGVPILVNTLEAESNGHIESLDFNPG